MSTCRETEKMRLLDVLEDVEQFSYLGKNILGILCIQKIFERNLNSAGLPHLKNG